MTNNAEQEAEDFYKDRYSEYNQKTFGITPPNFMTVKAAHLAGQSVGYQRALEEVLAGCIKDKFWLGPSDRFAPIIEIAAIERIIRELKAKGGA